MRELACHWHSPSATGTRKHKADPWHMSGCLHCVYGNSGDLRVLGKSSLLGAMYHFSRNVRKTIFSWKKTSHTSNFTIIILSTWCQDCKSRLIDASACRATDRDSMSMSLVGMWKSTNKKFELSGWVPLACTSLSAVMIQATTQASSSTSVNNKAYHVSTYQCVYIGGGKSEISKLVHSNPYSFT